MYCSYIFCIHSIFFLISKASALNEFNSTDNNTFICTREHDCDNMDIREILGQWKVMELYMHISKEGVNQYPTCPEVTIWETDDFPLTTFGPSTESQTQYLYISPKLKKDYRHLRLLWKEASETSEYALYFQNNTAGYWQVIGGQNGTLPSRKNYKQFSGSIQVLKADNDHLVLSFCQEPTNGRHAQFYSVLLSREPELMAIWELNTIHNTLAMKNYSIDNRRIVCQNSGNKPFKSITFSIFMFIIVNALSII